LSSQSSIIWQTNEKLLPTGGSTRDSFQIRVKTHWNAYLLGSSLAASIPITISIKVGDCSALFDRVEGQEMHLYDS